MKLAELMQRKGYSVRSLAKAAGVGASTIGYILNGREGQVYYAGPNIRRKVSSILEVDASEIDEFRAAIEYYLGKSLPMADKTDIGRNSASDRAVISVLAS